MPFEAIIFDCDGTLVDSEPIALGVMVRYLAELGVVASEAEAVSRFVGGKLADSIAALEASIGRRLPLSFVGEFRRRRSDAMRTHLRPIDGARELLAALDVPVAVASNGPLDQTVLSLEVTGLLPHFAANVFSAYDIQAWKPDPALFLHAAKNLGVEPSRCAVVEDSATGIEAGVAAGMTVFALYDCEPTHERVHRIRALSEILPFFLG
jgi:HAD superfamily hydrolase (TIGR01509 family)